MRHKIHADNVQIQSTSYSGLVLIVNVSCIHTLTDMSSWRQASVRWTAKVE